jgi:hypothetical protein
VLRLTLQHITKICRDPRRTGADKERILAKLGGARDAESHSDELVTGASHPDRSPNEGAQISGATASGDEKP